MPVNKRVSTSVEGEQFVILRPTIEGYGDNDVVLSTDTLYPDRMWISVGGRNRLLARDEVVELQKCLEGFVQMGDFSARAINDK